MRISDWSSDVCSSDLGCLSVEFEDLHRVTTQDPPPTIFAGLIDDVLYERPAPSKRTFYVRIIERPQSTVDSNLINQRESQRIIDECCVEILVPIMGRSEEHTSELQSLMRISYAVFCLKKKKENKKSK